MARAYRFVYVFRCGPAVAIGDADQAPVGISQLHAPAAEGEWPAWVEEARATLPGWPASPHR
jgi:hypothetical protein